MDKLNNQTFEMNNSILIYDIEKSTMLCKITGTNKNRWIKKINDITCVENIIEDSEKYYISCESYEGIDGYYLALNKANGSTEWYIPGKALFQIIFDNNLYLIFVDNKKAYYLLKVDRSNGQKIWYHQIDEDLGEYTFNKDKIILKYSSGKVEKISPFSGAIKRQRSKD